MSYKSSDIQILKGLTAVRTRPAMYVGDTGNKGLHHLVIEILDNSIDEAMAGFCTEISVMIHEDGETVSIEDDGRGIPVDIHQEEGKSALEVVMTTLHAGGKFGDSGYEVSGGLHGVGASCVNALSQTLKAEVWRDGGYWIQEYVRGVPKEIVKLVSKLSKKDKQHGTRITWRADSQIFKNGIKINQETLTKRFREVSFLNRGLKINFVNKQNNYSEIFIANGGISDYVKYMTENKSKQYPLVPIYGIEKAITDDNKNIMVEFAIQYTEEDDEILLSFANNINTVDGGTHISGFKTAITRVINQFARSTNAIKENKPNLTGDDVREGMTAIVSVRLPQPEFVGQTKAKLGTVQVEGIVNSAVSNALNLYFDKNTSIVKKIIERAIVAQEARDAAKKTATLIKRKSFLGMGHRLPGKLSDCNSNKREISELFIVEGDSAAGSAKGGRDPETQAILPIRGKIINTEKSNLSAAIKNTEIQSIIQAIGANFKEDFNIDSRRYDKVILMCLSGDTKIRTLDGLHPTIEELSQNGEKIGIWCKYGDKLIPKIVDAPRPTRKTKEWFKLEFSNGEKIECTKDHLFAVNSPDIDDDRIVWKIQGTGFSMPFIKAKDITDNDSICHVCFDYFPIGCQQKKYETVSLNCVRKEFSHRYIWKYFANTKNLKTYKDSKHDIHHIDNNELNNSPDNLEMLTSKEHLSKHFSPKKHSVCIKKMHEDGKYQGTSHFINYNKTLQHSENIKKHHSFGVYESNYDRTRLYNGSIKQKEDLKKNWSENGVYRSDEYKNKVSEGVKRSFQNTDRAQINSIKTQKYWAEHRFDKSMDRPLNLIRLILNKNNIQIEDINENIYENERRKNTIKWNTLISKFKNREEFIRYCTHRLKLNCRLVSRTIIKGSKQFYCFTIDGVGNFVLENGIVSGNCDADYDGHHIATLLITFFYKYMRPLIQHGHIYLARPPLFRVYDKKKKYYFWDEIGMSEKVKELNNHQVEVVRFKGLGEMDPDELAETTMDKEKRHLIQLQISDLNETERLISILMGNSAQSRKDHIVRCINAVNKKESNG